MRKKANFANYSLASITNCLPIKARLLVYNSLLMSHLGYCSLIYGCSKISDLTPLINLQKKAIRNIALAKYNAHCEPIQKLLGLLSFLDVIKYNQALFMYKFRYGLLPSSFADFFIFKTQVGMDRIRNQDGNYDIPPTPRGMPAPHVEAIRVWNALPSDLKTILEIKLFKKELKNLLLSKYEDECTLPKCFVCNPHLFKKKRKNVQLSVSDQE